MPNKLWQNEVVLEASPSLVIILITSMNNHSCSLMTISQGFCVSLSMFYLLYEQVRVHYPWFLLGLCSEWSLSSVLGYCSSLYLLCVQLCAFTLIAMAPIVRVEPNNTKLLDENLELLAKVEAVGWLPFIHKFANSNPKVTRLFSLSLVDARVQVADLQFRVDECSVALAMGLPLAGECWFKFK